MRYIYTDKGIVINCVDYLDTPTELTTSEGYDIVPDSLLNPGDIHPATYNKHILAQIADLEKTQDRAVREVLLGVTGSAARLSTLDGRIAALRLTLL